MSKDHIELPENPYLLLTPGPLSTTRTVKAAMLRDWCTWDDDYHRLVQDIRRKLVALGGSDREYTSVLMQGSGTFCAEACLGTALAAGDRLLVPVNGAYGRRLAAIAERLRIDHTVLDVGETARLDPDTIERALNEDSNITHVAVVHCETTTGMLNPVEEIGNYVKRSGAHLYRGRHVQFRGHSHEIDGYRGGFSDLERQQMHSGCTGFWIHPRPADGNGTAGRPGQIVVAGYV